MADFGSPRAWRAGVALVALALALPLAGCGSSDDAAAAGSGGSGGSGGNTAGPESLAFASETLTMVPGEVRNVSVQAKPAAVYRIRFALLGDARDASLDASEIDTDENGVASVHLTAPTESTTFTLRAAAGETVTQAGVAVSASGFATLQVKPVYSGKRSVSYWVASVRTGTTCAELSGKPLSDGDLKGSAANGQVPQISDVPVGPALAVTLRGAYSIAGCLDVAEVRAGEINAFSINVSDVPMNLSETDLLLDLGIEKAAPVEWSLVFDSIAGSVTTAMRDGAADDVTALLDAMQAATPTAADAAAFDTARSSESWDLLATTALGGLTAKTAIQDQVLLWMTEGAKSLAGPGVFRGNLLSTGKYPGTADFELEVVAGIPTEEAGFSKTNVVTTWAAEPGDNVLLYTNLKWAPSQLLTALAKPVAIQTVPTATGVADALAAQLSCKDVATALVAAPPNPTEGYPGCDVSCMRALCEDALTTIWKRAREASLTSPIPASIDVTATGAASVDDHARPTGFSGSWVGGLEVGATSVPLVGPATGYLPPPPS